MNVLLFAVLILLVVGGVSLYQLTKSASDADQRLDKLEQRVSEVQRQRMNSESSIHNLVGILRDKVNMLNVAFDSMQDDFDRLDDKVRSITARLNHKRRPEPKNQPKEGDKQ